ncbi:TPA: phage major capsid protein [Streptococcus suis]|uniref:phage major capsid protein n=1 Tax=Streptococcus suis TaxID=1307 RepID=UPI00211BCC89|nr:phage major capsid protein [Streptococcus suis]UUM55468.1 phage major capsid protein [Streptococcus suis]HEL1804190.1 phage major capsid protein [Streptococcus suis]HEL2033309.1 phage major capsid protein [Streptococcus suis]HEL2632284.1 phage major capsid protein [Streptococcus suis]HEM2688596.1 phage major capsid protein [Streptococcus suis]
MNKALIFGARMRAKATKVVELEESIKDLQKRTALEADKLERAETEEEVSAVEKTLEELQAELESKEAEKAELEKEIEDLQKQIDEQNRKAPTYEGGEDRGGKKKMEKREAVVAYVRSIGQKREGVKTTDVGAIIPKEVLQPQKEPERQNPLLNLIHVVNVSSGSGSYPVLKKSNRKMVEVGELEENPELGKTKITEVDYKIKTYRGELPLSREAIEDAQYDLIGIMQDDIQDQDEQTKLALVADILKTATVVNASGYDGLKDILNVKIKSVYNKVLVVTDSMFNALDKVKDKEGRYMLQPDITSPTGYSFSGKPIYPIADDLFGSEGDMKYFIGDIHYFLTLFDRMQLSVQWEDNHRFGKNLASYLRFDVKKTDADAGVFGTYTDAVL